MRLWDWAVAAYGADGVAPACLELQDAAGQNVPLLLWAGWCAAEARYWPTRRLCACGST